MAAWHDLGVASHANLSAYPCLQQLCHCHSVTPSPSFHEWRWVSSSHTLGVGEGGCHRHSLTFVATYGVSQLYGEVVKKSCKKKGIIWDFTSPLFPSGVKMPPNEIDIVMNTILCLRCLGYKINQKYIISVTFCTFCKSSLYLIQVMNEKGKKFF